jgi:hypothetical protein
MGLEFDIIITNFLIPTDQCFFWQFLASFWQLHKLEIARENNSAIDLNKLHIVCSVWGFRHANKRIAEDKT